MSRNIYEIRTWHGTVCKVPVTLLPTYHPICVGAVACWLPSKRRMPCLDTITVTGPAATNGKQNAATKAEANKAIALRPKISMCTVCGQHQKCKSWASQMLCHSEGKKIPMSVGLLRILENSQPIFGDTWSMSFQSWGMMGRVDDREGWWWYLKWLTD